MKELNLGHSDFKDVIENNNYFVDKTLLIEEIIKAQKAVILFPRPRRFGKTLNLSMLRYFFDRSMPENEKLFKELKIWQTGDEIKQHCCKYPVIYLTFKDAKAETWEETMYFLKIEIAKVYKQHRYLLKGDYLFEDEKIIFNEILTKKANVSELAYSLNQLSEYLQRYHKQKAVILIDEYDVPIQAGYKNFYKQVVSFMRNLLSGAFKDNSNLYKGVITGILRVSKESIFSGLNNISVYSILDSEFSDKFGFTDSEVKQIIKDFNVKTDYDLIKKWYNGYKFGETESIYNPWSILNFAVSKDKCFKPYWTNTSSNDLIKNEIKKKDASGVRTEILKLINNETIKKDIEENFVFADLDNRKTMLWTLLTYSGYLTIKKQVKLGEYELRIPNYELKIIFKKTILEWFEADVKVIKSLLEETANYLISNNIQKFEQGFKQIIGDTFSYYDTAKNHEYIYQSYILGLLAIIGDDYIIKSNKESGEGRYDIMLIPRSRAYPNGVVIEIKQIYKQQPTETDEDFIKRINKQIELAKNQIDRNKYCKELIDNGLKQEQIIKVPIIFAGKEPYVTPAKTQEKFE